MDETGMTTKTLYSCGDSYMSVDYPAREVTSFLELYCEQKGFRHVSLARAGATNFMIRMQIEYAINNRADYVVVSNTSVDRIDIVLDTDNQNGWFTLNHILHEGYKSASEQAFSNPNPELVSDTINNIMWSTHENLVPEQKKQAIKHWVADLHNHSLQRQKDYFLISDGLRKLKEHGIPFVYLPKTSMGFIDWSWVELCWPADQPCPSDMPNGPYDYEKTVTHNDQSCHNHFAETLKNITTHWS